MALFFVLRVSTTTRSLRVVESSLLGDRNREENDDEYSNSGDGNGEPREVAFPKPYVHVIRSRCVCVSSVM